MQSKEFAVCTAGVATILSLWGYAAFALAPSMQTHLQQHSDQLLQQIEYPVTAHVDGLDVAVRGAVPDAEVRFAVNKALAPLHPIARVRLQLDFPRSSQRPDWLGGERRTFGDSAPREEQNDQQGADVFVVPDSQIPDATHRCGELAELDPNFSCGWQ